MPTLEVYPQGDSVHPDRDSGDSGAPKAWAQGTMGRWERLSAIR